MISVVLVEPEGPANIGMVARTMKNFGFSRLVLVSPNLTEESYDYAVHAGDVLDNAIILDDFEEAVDTFDLTIGTTGKPGRSYNPRRAPLMPWELRDVLEGYGGRVGIFFGRESTGFHNWELERLDFTVTIPTSELYPVMNLAQAVAVILYELSKSERTPPSRSLEPATSVEMTELTSLWRALLDTLDYPKDPGRRDVSIKLFRRVLGRGVRYGREAHTLMGPLRRAVKRLGECSDD